MRFPSLTLLSIIPSIVTARRTNENEFINLIGQGQRDLAIIECLWCSKGADPPAGKCQEYDCGGSSGVHYYTCCNFGRGAADGIEYDGASDGDYCGDNGKNKGGGCKNGKPFECRGAAGAKECKDWCDENAITFPGACWNWTDCFDHCCEDDDGPKGGVDGWIPITWCNENDRGRELLRGSVEQQTQEVVVKEPTSVEGCTCTQGYVPGNAQCSPPTSSTCGDIEIMATDAELSNVEKFYGHR
mmetsp:Transcript_19450/g.29238  ORF Transcript_19450/g.29238 Transcript_19450/m.29238 type:complete len:243 (+) Transcript_19450:369-1097(+)